LRESQHINGFCLGFTSETLKETMYNKKYYFNPAYPFEYNEIEWQKRLKERGGKIMIVEGCYVFHHKDHAWTKIHLNYFQKMKNKIGFWMYKIHPRLYSACARFFPYKDYSTK
jgi:GT2 family glycosyltransferase